MKEKSFNEMKKYSRQEREEYYRELIHTLVKRVKALDDDDDDLEIVIVSQMIAIAMNNLRRVMSEKE